MNTAVRPARFATLDSLMKPSIWQRLCRALAAALAFPDKAANPVVAKVSNQPAKRVHGHEGGDAGGSTGAKFATISAFAPSLPPAQSLHPLAPATGWATRRPGLQERWKGSHRVVTHPLN